MNVWQRMFPWIERGLIGSGVAALAWCAFVLAQGWMYQRLATGVLVTRPDLVAPRQPIVFNDSSGVPEMVPPGAPIAELKVPRLSFSVVVLEGSDPWTLRRGPGHLEHSAWPGRSGNVAIAGHRDTFFRRLREVQVGDDIVLDAAGGRALYRIESARIVDASDLSVLEPTPEPTLTLITCYPFWYVGNAPKRFVVRATRRDEIDD
jgi:sortase A